MSQKLFLLIAILALVLASLGCNVTLNAPVEKISTGPLQTETIQIASPDAELVKVDLQFGAGDLTIAPGNGVDLISGVATYNVEEFKPVITVEDHRVSLETGNFEFSRIPDFRNYNDLKNQWDLTLGNFPMDLSITAGAYKGEYELGGLSIQNLEISDGAADVNLRFSAANLVAMDSLRYTTGASNVKLYGLGYANFSSMIFRGGAGDYLLDFTGGLLRDGVVKIESGVSQVSVIVPEGVNAKVIFNGGLATVDTSGNWQKNGDQYVLNGSGPVLTINVDLGAGSLNLKTSE
jgi:hypothetical protein